MAGRHAVSGAPRVRRTPVILAAVTLVTALLIAAYGWRGGDEPAPTVSASPAPAADPDRHTAADRPSRGGDRRADRPRASPAPAPADPEPPQESEPEPEPQPQPEDGGSVVETGSCEASYYWEPQPTASGEVFDPEAMTAAHLTLDFDTRVRVTNPATGDSVVVRINDRGPYVDGRCLDLSRGAFGEIASLDSGVIMVTYEVLSD
jgi:rare lipoprotein A